MMLRTCAFLAILTLAVPAAAQCPGDPTTGNPVTRQLVLTLGAGIPATAPDAMLRMAAAIQAQGHAVSVMDNNGPSDHKAWIDGEAWTLRSSDPVRCAVVVWSPYLQAPYDGGGFSACGIPTSAHLGCPSWFAPSAQPAPTPVVVPPPSVAPPVPAPDDPRFAVLGGQIAAVAQQLAQLTTRVQQLEARPVYATCAAALNLGATKIPISCRLQ